MRVVGWWEEVEVEERVGWVGWGWGEVGEEVVVERRRRATALVGLEATTRRGAGEGRVVGEDPSGWGWGREEPQPMVREERGELEGGEGWGDGSGAGGCWEAGGGWCGWGGRRRVVCAVGCTALSQPQCRGGVHTEPHRPPRS